ncbi:YopX family protein [Bacillus altitudinis]|uniref:YopX family protein n=1 Tax=Bacillus TaxID=1386 RepID=UPI00162059C0|nr:MULTISPECIES: YopX family protein [Bacillus]MBB6601792.1 hypothetical protein [Bacillus pumilus]MCY7631432.1 YopX family protein [Bacillus altitudinis]MDT1122076.1 YopX family protein [Bacillus altitudinis]WLF28838.1 YopX family protein [Bacillus altitudinis]
MREIKFRAWYGSRLGMMTPSFNGDINEIFAQKHGDYMQFTGLKDCNGVEIYEGDIIHCVHWFFNGDEIEEHFTASVGFRDGSFTLENIQSRYYSNFTGEENGKGICWIGEINYCEEDYEVIGNIYENPELLTEK